MARWVRALKADEIAPESIEGFDYNGTTIAIIRSLEGEFYATDGYCTHERALLCEGSIFGHEIECPRHLGAFDYRTGEAVVAPAEVDLTTYEVRLADGFVEIKLPD